jgi:C4-dicarboxylate transporter
MDGLNFLDQKSKDESKKLTEVIDSSEKDYLNDDLLREEDDEEDKGFPILYAIFAFLPMVILIILFSL